MVLGRADPLTYYTGSVLRLEWTNQHACGPNPNVFCEVVIQYGCKCKPSELAAEGQDETYCLRYLRDGYPTEGLPNPQLPNTASSGSFTDSGNGNVDGAYYYGTFRENDGGTNYEGTGTIPFSTDPNNGNFRSQVFYSGNFSAYPVNTAEWTDALNGVEYGYHESATFYKERCLRTERNHGLYLADQKINGDGAERTRQNPGGTRRGLECDEEREYHPYWRPSPFKDIAVLTSDLSHCDYFQMLSQNVYALGQCDNCGDACQQASTYNRIPITMEACIQGGGSWRTPATNGVDLPPDCKVHMYSRDNHLGNAYDVTESGGKLLSSQPETAHYNWLVSDSIVEGIDDPEEGLECIIRMRYNMSTGDYPGHSVHLSGGDPTAPFYDSKKNCPRIDRGENQDNVEEDVINSVADNNCVYNLTLDSKPLYNRPHVRVWDDDIKLALAINTHQTSRTFEDRSYVFKVARRPASDVSNSVRIYNLNCRGKRGNIVQSYPGVEYDFVPNRLEVSVDDVVAIGLHGSDFNEARNPNNGEGWEYSDRFNIVEMVKGAENYPIAAEGQSLFDDELARQLALLDQSSFVPAYLPGFKCNDNPYPKKGNNAEDNNARENCAKLNNAPNTFRVLWKVQPGGGAGTYPIASTRNNNFSNRSQKGTIIVSDSLSAGAIAAIAVGSIAFLGMLGYGFYWANRHPNSTLGKLFCQRPPTTPGV